MAPLWDRLGELTMPVDVVVGERDAKLRRARARAWPPRCPAARLTVVPGAGHGLPREARRGARRRVPRAEPGP